MKIGKDRINVDRMETTDTAEPNLNGVLRNKTEVNHFMVVKAINLQKE